MEKTASLPLENLPVEYVSNFSFLGIVLDRKLTWGPHIARLKERSQKDLRLLSLLAHTKWSADYVSLRIIYTAVLLRKIEYGGFLFATAAPTHLLTLNCIQYAAAVLFWEPCAVLVWMHWRQRLIFCLCHYAIIYNLPSMLLEFLVFQIIPSDLLFITTIIISCTMTAPIQSPLLEELGKLLEN